MRSKKFIGIVAFLMLYAEIVGLIGIAAYCDYQQATIQARQQEKKAPGWGCSIHCMDKRCQKPIPSHIVNKYNVEVDVVTDAGPVKLVVDNDAAAMVRFKRMIVVSAHHHKAKLLFISAHAECAGNPVSKEAQIEHLRQTKKIVQSWPEAKGFEIVLLWLEKDFKTVVEID